MRERYVAADAGADLDPYAELLHAFADQRLGLGLPGLDLAAGKLPSAGDLGRISTRARQYPSVLDNCRTDDDPLYGPFGLHGASACQTKERLGVQGCPQPHQITELWLWTHGGHATTLGPPTTTVRRRNGHKPATTPWR